MKVGTKSDRIQFNRLLDVIQDGDVIVFKFNV